MEARSKAPSFALLAVGSFALVAACVPGVIAVGLLRAGDGRWRDVTTREAAVPGAIADGETVWLRATRDITHPITLDDGRVLYPTREDPRLMVDCANTACAGALTGSMRRVDVTGRMPGGWPDGVGPRVRVLVVGDVGDVAREKANVAAVLSVGLMGVGITCCILGVVGLIRRRRAAGANPREP